MLQYLEGTVWVYVLVELSELLHFLLLFLIFSVIRICFGSFLVSIYFLELILNDTIRVLTFIL